MFEGSLHSGPPCAAGGEARAGRGGSAKCDVGWRPPPRRKGSGWGDFRLAAKVRGLSLEPPLHTHRDAPSVPPRYSSSPRDAHTRAGPRPTPHHAVADHFAFALCCAQGLEVDEHLLELLLLHRRACGTYGRATLRWPVLELRACNPHAKKNGSLSAAMRVRWACVRECAMYRASRGRSDACPLTI